MSLKFICSLEKRNEFLSLIFNNKDLVKFLNKIMLSGKKSKAVKILVNVLFLLEEEFKKRKLIFTVLEGIKEAIKVIKPEFLLVSKKIGGALYSVPYSLTAKQAYSYSLKWLILNSRKRIGLPMYKKLSLEIIETLQKTSNTFKFKVLLDKNLKSSRVFSHLNRKKKKKVKKK